MFAQAPSETTLASIAESIASDAKTLTSVLDEHHLPHPTLAADGPLKYPAGPDFAKLHEARMNLVSSAWALEALAAGPHDYMYWQAFTAKHDLTALSVLTRFGVFGAVPITGDISYADLSTKVPLTERQVRRLIRHAMTKNIFREPCGDHVSHTSLSMAMLKTPALTPWMNHNLGEILPASSRLADTIERYGEPQNPADVALALAWNWKEGTSLFDWFANDGKGAQKGWRARQFAQAMAAMDGGSHDARFTVAGFDWASLRKATVVDVGGSSGHVSVAIAQAFPNLRFVVQDLPEVEAAFEAFVPAELRSRISFQAHSFMTPQPAEDAKVYLLRHVLHDWPDGIAQEILRNIINSSAGVIKDGTRIILVENVLPPLGSVPTPIERLTTSADLQMWVACNSLERRKEDWAQLVKHADSRLDLVASVSAEGTDTVMEVVFRS